MVHYEDLLTVKYKKLGRNIDDGLDCYGLVLELCRRNGTPLVDLLYPELNKNLLKQATTRANVEEIIEDEARQGDLIQCVYHDNIHLGYMLDKIAVIHMTHEGVKITPVLILNDKHFYRIKEL